MLRLTDLREILRYVPRFRDRVFVIAIDGSIVEDENFQNILLDIALLRSLNIRVALVHGAARQIERYAQAMGITPSNLDGTGITDEPTLQVAITAANRVTHEILEGLSANDLRGACPNALVAHPAGILQGIDHLETGKVERIDALMIQTLTEHDIIPVLPPIGVDGMGRSYRLNSDAVAVEVAKTLNAVKLIYITSDGGVRGPRGIIRQLTVQEAEQYLKAHRAEMSDSSVTKLTHAVRAGLQGIERIHIIDGREQEGLLGEVFSNEGIGTLIYTNEYQAIRMATKKDVRAIFTLIQNGMKADELLRRTRTDLERSIGDYFVFEMDRNPVACGALHFDKELNIAELASLYVDPRYENRGIGGRMISYAVNTARSRGVRMLFCLSTQAINYFIHKGGFELGTPEHLPLARRNVYMSNGRRSQVLIKTFEPTTSS